MDRTTVVIGVPNATYRAMLARAVAQQADMQVAGEAAGGLEAGRLAEARQPDVLLLEIGLPHAAGLKVLRRLRAKSPRTKVLLLAGDSGDAFGGEALAAGVKGYLPRGGPREEVLTAIRLVSSGGIWGPPSILAEAVKRLVEHTSPEGYSRPGEGEPLTRREHEVMKYAALGKTNKEIAGQLGIGEQTVKAHFRNIFRKLEITRREHEVMKCAALGKTNKEIAGQLGIGEETVKAHLRNIFRKLQIARPTQLMLQRP